ncbi:MAG TPA: S8 family serine peptidase [Gammaproteobacteria bacterium]|nr:S8 family serine peptidase [Gammaproteobacteria bacterium]
MKPLRFLIALTCVAAGCASLDGVDTRLVDSEATLSRQLLITTRQESGAAVSLLGSPGDFYFRRRAYGPTPVVDRTLDQFAEDYDIRRVEGWYVASIGEYCEVYEVGPGQAVEEVIERISADPRVELVQAMNVFETQGVTYNDPLASMQTALSSLAIESAHEAATGRGVTVAVIDSTVDSRHRELRGRIHPQRNLVDAQFSRRPELHGTAVAGVIGSTANNGEGIVGVAPESTIASLRACWTVDPATGRAQCSSFSVARALEAAIELDADVVNLSLSGPFDPLLSVLIDAAIAQGIIVVAALPVPPVAGDNAFPSSHRLVIAAESSQSPAMPNASNLLRAPGVEVMSTAPNNSYAFFSGNSMSAAYVSGVSALIRELRPDIAPAELIELLVGTATERSVNACRAVAQVEGSELCAD